MTIIDRILQSQLFKDQAPVLIDIGASGEINAKWAAIAPYSICLAFDADDREFHITEAVDKTYKKLITVNRIVTAQPTDKTSFYLTASPFCSSLLEPDNARLEPWIFSSLFKVDKITSLPATTISDALRQAGITYIDWFKTDTQGTDLRLYNSLSDNVRSGILAAEFEPGIMDAYKGEDKLYTIMQQMHGADYWLSSMEVKGTQRLHKDYIRDISPFFAQRMLRKTPGWAEITYLRQPGPLSVRQILLLYIFALVEKQYGFAIEIAVHGKGLFPQESLFETCRLEALKKLTAGKRSAPLVFIKRQINKLFSNIHD